MCVHIDSTTVYGLPINMQFVLGGIERDDQDKIMGAEVFLIALDVAYMLVWKSLSLCALPITMRYSK